MVDIVSRSVWGARSGSWSSTPWSSRTAFTVHYSSGPTSQTPRQIQDFHMDGNGWSDVGYNLLVDSGGTAYEGRGWTAVGAHAAPHNRTHLGVCFIGSDGDATNEAKAAIRALYDQACDKAGRTLEMTYHGALSGNSTSCPGADLRAWVENGMPATGGGATGGDDPMIGLSKGDDGEAVKALQALITYAGVDLPEYGVDGDYGDETAEGLRQVRASVGSEAGPGWGETVTGYAYAQLMRAVARAEAE